jgi:aminoglycoside phosphotransferase
MKAAGLLAREPFAAVLESTLMNFLHLRFGGSWEVRWRERSTVATLGAQLWLCNLTINAIFRNGALPQVFEVVRREFSSTPVRWRRPLQRLYFEMTVSHTFAARLANARLEIVPAIPGSEGWLLVAGGTKLRVIDTAASRVYCCRKSNASLRRFRGELTAREHARQYGVRVPKLVDELSADCVTEQMIVGTPPNRLASANETARAINSARETLAKLHNATKRESGFQEYCEALFAESGELVHGSGYFESRMNEVEHCAKQLRSLTSLFADKPVATAVAHGDFQPGNILWDGSASWLVDWEHSCRRQFRYDELVLELCSRFPKGLAARIEQRLRASSAKSRDEQACELALFLLEEFVFHLRDGSALSAQVDFLSWSFFLKEFDVACNVLKTYAK